MLKTVTPTKKDNKFRVTFGHIEIGDSAKRYLNEAINKNWVSEGANVKQFEKKFGALFNYPHTIATSSGTDAGIVAMTALLDMGAKRGDEVITPACAFVATTNCILAAGLTPKFVDIELDTLNINPDLIEAAITPRTRAIQVVHTMGKPCKMGKIMEIAKRHNLVVIEDSCEAHGASLNGNFIGSFGDMALFSFYAAHMVCSGEGGMIAAKSEKVDALCRSIRSHGRRNGELYFCFDRPGYNSKMNDLEAAIGLEGIENFKHTFDTRRGYLLKLQEMLSPFEDRVMIYRDGPGEVTCPHAFPLVMRDANESMDEFYRHLEDNGIQCKNLFGSLPTQHNAFKFLGYKSGDFPVSERVGKTGLHFGVHQYLNEDDLSFIRDTVASFFKK